MAQTDGDTQSFAKKTYIQQQEIIHVFELK